MSRRGSPRLEGYAILAAVGLVAALALRRPELAVVAAPFALVLAIGLQLAHEPRLDIQFTVAGERTVERADIDAEIVVRAESSVDRLELLLDLPKGVEVEGDDAEAVRLRAGDERTIPVRLRWVAMTRKGRSSRCVSPSIVTWRSCIASSSAACVFGGARLISSARRRFVKIGPGRNSKSTSR